MFTTLKCGDLQWRVWSIDGNIKYLSGKHILLFTIPSSGTDIYSTGVLCSVVTTLQWEMF